MKNPEIHEILTELGAHVPSGSQLILVGGGALALLGNPRPTFDLDFLGDDVHPNELHRLILRIAAELQIQAEPVPLERFIPLPPDSTQRNLYIGQFGNLEIYVADPYSIALSKLDRGLDSDLDDAAFLVRKGFVEIQKLERMVQEVLPQAGKFDLNPDLLEHLSELRRRLGKPSLD